MIREKLSMIFSSKIFYVVFSLLVSIALWMYVEINENQIQQYEIPNVQIIRQNSELLNDRGFFIASMNPEAVKLTFECTRSVYSKLSNTTLSVTIDLASITSRGNKILEYNIDYPIGITPDMAGFVAGDVSRISLYVDRMETRLIDVDVQYLGGTAEDYIQDPPEYSPQTITVSGPRDMVSRVSSAHVNVNRENLTSTFTDDLPFILLDENGEEFDELSGSQLTASDETIHVTIPIRMMKEVTLTVEFNYGAGATSQNTVYTIDPPTVMIAGNVEDVRDYNSINLGTIDLTSFDYSRTFPPYTIVIPNYFTRISGETEATVTVEILGLDMKYFSISNIQVANEPDGYIAEIISRSLDVRVRGRTEDLENLTEANIRIVANIPDEYSLGTQRVPGRAYVDGIDADIGAVSTINVTIAIITEPVATEPEMEE